jgi:hypothetical protein
MAERALMHKNTNQNRECCIGITETAEDPALLGCYCCKTNPPAGMNQRADCETCRCVIAAAARLLPVRLGPPYIAMCDTGSLQSPAPVLPPMAHNCSV